MRILELFSGTGSVGKAAQALGWDVVSLDLRKADINTNIMDWDYKTLFPPKWFDVVWASFPCETFSITRQSNLGRIGKDGLLWTREKLRRDILNVGLPLLHKSEEIINYFNPQYYFLENPATGAAKNYLTARPMYVVDYCQYAPEWGYRKRTSIWTNVIGFHPKICDPKTCVAVVRNVTTGRLRHRLCTDSGNAKAGTIGTTTKERYRIPPTLLQELFALCL